MLQLNNKYIQLMMEWLKENDLCNNGNEDYQLYTLQHKQAFVAVQLALNKSISYSGIQHDNDKLLLYGIMTKKEASIIHRKYARHHIENCSSGGNLEDCIIDYECARFTKSDKPLNAYNTIMEYRKDTYALLQPTLVKYRINSEIDSDINFGTWNRINYYMADYIMQKSIESIQYLRAQMADKKIEDIIRDYYLDNEF